MRRKWELDQGDTPTLKYNIQFYPAAFKVSPLMKPPPQKKGGGKRPAIHAKQNGTPAYVGKLTLYNFAKVDRDSTGLALAHQAVQWF